MAASSFAQQLQKLAASSTHELDLRARRALHSESLLFPAAVAAKQDWDTIYSICHEGFRDLCDIDGRFLEYGANLFSAQSARMDREQMTQQENTSLDGVIVRFLGLVAARVLLAPGLRCVEWLVRRFRVHVHNTTALLLSVLPYHEMSIWRNILSIVPRDRLVGELKWIAPYKKENANVPRHTIGYAATNNNGFFSRLNRYVIEACKEKNGHPALMRFWASVVTEAVAGRMDQAKSGRKEVQKQKTEDALLLILPLLSDGFEIGGSKDLKICCFTLAMIVAAKAELDDRVLDSLLQAVAITLEDEDADVQATIVTMTVIVNQKQEIVMPKSGVDAIANVPDIDGILQAMYTSYPVAVLAEALVAGAVRSIKKKNVARRISLVQSILLFAGKKDHATFKKGVKAVISTVKKLETSENTQGQVMNLLLDMLRRLNDDPDLSQLIADSIPTELDLKQFEALLGNSVKLIEAPVIHDADLMEVELSQIVLESYEQSLSSLPTRTVDTSSFLAKHETRLFNQLAESFKLCYKHEAGLKHFQELPLWLSSSPTLLCSFLLRIAYGPYVARERIAALDLLSQTIRTQNLNAHFVIPYALVGLSDASAAVRKSASKLLVAVEIAAKMANGEDDQATGAELYGSGAIQNLPHLAASQTRTNFLQVLLFSSEECVLDDSYISKLITTALSGVQSHATTVETEHVEMKKSSKHYFFELLTSHAVATPLFKVQIGIIRLLKDVHKVGSFTKSKAMSPMLAAWALNDDQTALDAATAEKLSVTEIDGVMMQLITTQDKDAVGRILEMFEDGKIVPRSALITAFFDRTCALWKDLKPETQTSAALKLFKFAFHENTTVQQGAQGVLHAVTLQTSILGGILEEAMNEIASIQHEGQPKKRRRTSHGRESLPTDNMAQAVSLVASRLTLALELVDNSRVKSRPELAPILFDLLAAMKRLKQQQQLDSPYLLNLCLSNILAIIDSQRLLSRPVINVSSIRADVVTDCIRLSENPQVQNTALLLSASLANLVPEHMLHNVMPIFTFMGQSMFSKEDDHSIHVTNQAIDQIVPALVSSLKTHNKDIVKSTSGLLVSFATAFDHIPQSRRVAVYQRLLRRMGADDFTYIIIAMLASRKAHSQDFMVFLGDLLTELSVPTQMITYQKLVDLANDALEPKPQLAAEVLEMNPSASHEDRQKLSKLVFNVALQILKGSSLKGQMGKIHKLGPETANIIRGELNKSLSQILSTIGARRQTGDDVEEAKQCLDALLALPTLGELFSILPATLAIMNDQPQLKSQALRVVASKLEGHPPKDSKTRIAAISLLSTLTDMLQETVSSDMKQAIIVAIDRISDAYGRKDIESVLAASNAICSDHCLGSEERRVQIMSLLCLASLLEVLREACVPIVPEMMTKVLDALNIAVEMSDEELHSSAYALFASITTHVPFLVTDSDLNRLMVLSTSSATKFISSAAKEARAEALSIVAQKVEISSVLESLLNDDLALVFSDPSGTEMEKLDMLSVAIQSASKTNIVKSADLVSQILLAHLDQRRRFREDNDENMEPIDHVEDKISQIGIQFVYKLNDASFRPIFESWAEWANKAYDIQPEPQNRDAIVARQTSLFKLLNDFFASLKSIVTSYASYIIEPISTILSQMAETVPETKKIAPTKFRSELYTSVLDLLMSTFTHDADGFFSTPSHFNPLGPVLVSQLKLAATKSQRSLVYSHVIPTITALVSATLDSPAHHQTLCHHLTQLRHSPSSAVRLASIKAIATLSSDEDIGDEWIANTIGVGSAATGDGNGVGIATGGGSSAGEVMIYVNEMLEDDDEEVEMSVRRWVQSIREKVGEDVFEV